LALDDRDYILPMHRNTGVWTTRGLPMRPLFCQLMGKEGGYTKGRDRTYHFGLPEKRIVGMISHMAAMLPVACGLGLASRLAGDDFVALCFAGDGGTREGDFHEAMNLASVWSLPVIFVVENNGYGLSTPTEHAVAPFDIADAAVGYAMPGIVADGNDLLEVLDVVRAAATRARSGKGPTLIEMKTFRMRGHEEASGTWYVPVDRFEAWKPYDPVRRMARRILDDGLLTEDELDAIHQELLVVGEEAAEFAIAQPEVKSTLEDERADLWAAAPAILRQPGEKRSERRFIDAITDGLRQAMEDDDRVILMGQDIAEYGGVFKVTKGFVEQFGQDRVRSTPIIESGAV